MASITLLGCLVFTQEKGARDCWQLAEYPFHSRCPFLASSGSLLLGALEHPTLFSLRRPYPYCTYCSYLAASRSSAKKKAYGLARLVPCWMYTITSQFSLCLSRPRLQVKSPPPQLAYFIFAFPPPH